MTMQLDYAKEAERARRNFEKWDAAARDPKWSDRTRLLARKTADAALAAAERFEGMCSHV